MVLGTLSKQLVLFLLSIVVRATQRGWHPRLLLEHEEFSLPWSLMVVFPPHIALEHLECVGSNYGVYCGFQRLRREKVNEIITFIKC